MWERIQEVCDCRNFSSASSLQRSGIRTSSEESGRTMIASDFLRLRTRVYGMETVYGAGAVYGVEAVYGVGAVYGMGAVYGVGVVYGVGAGAPFPTVRRSVRDSVNPEEAGMATPPSKRANKNI